MLCDFNASENLQADNFYKVVQCTIDDMDMPLICAPLFLESSHDLLNLPHLAWRVVVACVFKIHKLSLQVVANTNISTH